MSKILFDHQIFSLQVYGGISRYFANIKHALEKEPDCSGHIGVLYSKNYYIQNYKAPIQNLLGKRLFASQEKEYKWNKKYSKYLINKNDFDVLHPTYYEPYFLKKLKKPYVITVHDMIHELMPDSFPWNDIAAVHKREILANATKIIAISETTKNDLKKILNIEDSRIEVIYHGYQPKNQSFHPSKNNLEENKYILFVGARSGYKNFNRLVNAIAPFLKSKKINLICTGGGNFQKEETELFKKLEIDKYVIQFSVSDQHLEALYSNALAFVFPSIYEGFGLPILEAFQSRCPVILSNSTCFKEVAADAAEYFDPMDEHSILASVVKIIENRENKDLLVEKAIKRLENFTPQACFDKTIALYKSIS
ncbi:glycosyltransferase family 4 protein [Pedobacter mendelii]|uniref:Mannosyltransferase n=1 Tax=Pedobacter mendelii TaxID=1908240 RepID=A0ABQ2BFT9_9SPHI|nr:glycosyltransferase family 1 protein [Pedobacter mendelii]GGI22897.1 mannosyltransferase [Pedobacter mendelii]